MTLPNNKVKLALTEVDYKPFISLFNVTNATVTNPEISGIGERTIADVSVFAYTVLNSRLCLRYCFRAIPGYCRRLCSRYEIQKWYK